MRHRLKTIGILTVAILIMSGCAAKGPTYKYSQTNLIKNAGFEQMGNNSIPGWKTNGSIQRSRGIKAFDGKIYLMGSTKKTKVNVMTTSQIISLVDMGFKDSLLDSQTMRVHFGGFQAGWGSQKDSGVIRLGFYDENKLQIKGVHTGEFYSNKIWTKRESVVGIPKGTRYLKYTFYAKRVAGSDNDAYLDNAFIYVAHRVNTGK